MTPSVAANDYLNAFVLSQRQRNWVIRRASELAVEDAKYGNHLVLGDHVKQAINELKRQEPLKFRGVA